VVLNAEPGEAGWALKFEYIPRCGWSFRPSIWKQGKTSLGAKKAKLTVVPGSARPLAAGRKGWPICPIQIILPNKYCCRELETDTMINFAF
jgi:hypothetical protein